MIDSKHPHWKELEEVVRNITGWQTGGYECFAVTALEDYVKDRIRAELASAFLRAKACINNGIYGTCKLWPVDQDVLERAINESTTILTDEQLDRAIDRHTGRLEEENQKVRNKMFQCSACFADKPCSLSFDEKYGNGETPSLCPFKTDVMATADWKPVDAQQQIDSTE